MNAGPLTLVEHRADFERIARSKLNAAMERVEARYATKRQREAVDLLEDWWNRFAKEAA